MDDVVGSIPVETQSRSFSDMLHLNVRCNPSSFAVMPVDRMRTTLLEVRNYIRDVRFVSLAPQPTFYFLSRNGGRIPESQEASIVAWNESVEQQWPHHTFKTLITRNHLFISFAADDITVMV